MEEAGTQVANPVFVQRVSTTPTVKKRSLPLRGIRQCNNQQSQSRPSTAGFQNRTNDWNPKHWEWDSSNFVAKPLVSDAIPQVSPSPINVVRNAVGDGLENESLSLKLGGSSNDVVLFEDPVVRPTKRVRSSSPTVSDGGNGHYPKCQVDNCKEDLSTAKDYHRRHKVCEVHSKATRALVGKQMQRFCQQCSRFHPLPEFDEGKRSCRRRLAGHNKRRRKTQPDDVTPQLVSPANPDKTGNGDMDIVNLLAALARAQGTTDNKVSNCPSVAQKDQLIQILNKINSLPLPKDSAANLPVASHSKNVEDKLTSESQNKLDGNTKSTVDLLAVLSASMATPAPDSLATNSTTSNQGCESPKSIGACRDQASFLNLCCGHAVEYPSGGERSTANNHSPGEEFERRVHKTSRNLSLQLFSSSPENDSLTKMPSSRNYFSSDSSDLMEERSLSSSPPVMQRLFPIQATAETEKPEIMSINDEVAANVKDNTSHTNTMSLELFGRSNCGAENGSIHSQYQAGYTSSSGSDQSPSLNSDAQDRTGRIVFKLFDKDPSNLPCTLRTQIYSWLSNSPSEMEGYIRPGCVVLSIYASMSSSAWKQLKGNFLQYVDSLVHGPDTEFWRNGRFIVHTDGQMASRRDGKIYQTKSRRVWNRPKLISVSPLAVVSGKETSLLLKGRNLRTSGTKVYCTHTADCTLVEVSESSCQTSAYDEINVGCFAVHSPCKLGRCFIEVENGFRATSFPVIIADATICQELTVLETEFEEGEEVHDAVSENHAHDPSFSGATKEILHFLNELGWLFQRKGVTSFPRAPDYSLSRFKFLFIYSVERDFCSLIKTLLDILAQGNVCTYDGLSTGSLEMLLDIDLLSRAVKRRSKRMVDLLLHYSVANNNGTPKKYIFTPSHVGADGMAPLHFAACISNSDDVVDSLTSDPQEIGLSCWNSLHDLNGVSPYFYALARNNHSYNKLVARKVADRKAGQVSVPISNEIDQQNTTDDLEQRPSFQVKQVQRSCSRCSLVAERYHRRVAGSPGLLSRTFVHSILAVAAVCVCVCILLRGGPNTGLDDFFQWEKLKYCSM